MAGRLVGLHDRFVNACSSLIRTSPAPRPAKLDLYRGLVPLRGSLCRPSWPARKSTTAQIAPHSTAPHSIALHCTAPHSTALHCTAQHRTHIPMRKQACGGRGTASVYTPVFSQPAPGRSFGGYKRTDTRVMSPSRHGTSGEVQCSTSDRIRSDAKRLLPSHDHSSGNRWRTVRVACI